ncbi:MAG: bifunctional 4-hydroxy-2-oxoglutarate aldolase/2-dehydro-3-deoxy-phosphogluconate aldolase [Ferruginibacter sp.]|nr:bifunctional 4-hydroxy-2-oxoglutarate aldolase/2-dehydro-3-deoxy-phosphogluconate aldolase [Ferruginibacter sp.]
MKKETLLALIPQQGILPLYFYKDTQVSIDLLKALYTAGIRTVEYTNRGEAALANFKAMRAVCDNELKDMYLGIGTIKNGEMAQTFIDAGCDYIICPGLVESVAKVADANDMLWVPGCMTPSEVIAAENLGAKMIKLFPGNIIGMAFMQAIKDLFPNLLFMPTGGVDTTKENIEGWFKSGVCAVGMGSKLVTKSIMDNKQYDELITATKNVLAIISDCKK